MPFPSAVDTGRAARLARCRALAGLAATLVLGSCGGGGSDAADTPSALATGDSATAPAPAPNPPPPPPPPSPPPAPTPAPAPAPAPASSTASATCGLADFATQALQRINALRAGGANCGGTPYAPAAALTWQPQLDAAAAGHSADMAARNYFSHTSPEGVGPGTRITNAGYVWRTYGENIAAGYGSVEAVVAAWTASPGHCTNLMNPNVQHMALACVRATGGSYPTYWTLNLAAPR
ncbi:CAP domain-containing protein [Calidifontimicrobium sp. SYSU G02091]|uniref:CAP domain-containing protein n=1 Tax=Calidifontimicrobium sp. SYSU G02091 TaxID=2926421 RepID=UPI001F53AB0C|nr:CAP domain-containing protein [Calidifontimicrobium sp. SYSU G02091]MCI1191721.1 CAP domain-containing protein [Calidifontimicrobium sp. SYSU G02091]